MEMYRPQMTMAGMPLTSSVDAIDASGKRIRVEIPNEFPLTIYLDRHEVATLMTLGTHPEELVLGYLRSMGMIRDVEGIASVRVNWEEETARVTTFHGNAGADQGTRATYRMVTSGCGQSMMFDCLLQSLYAKKLPARQLRQSAIYSILRKLSDQNTIYRTAGSVHGCALCTDSDVLFFVEDVGRHNAADVISGRIWLERVSGEGKLSIYYGPPDFRNSNKGRRDGYFHSYIQIRNNADGPGVGSRFGTDHDRTREKKALF